MMRLKRWTFLMCLSCGAMITQSALADEKSPDTDWGKAINITEAQQQRIDDIEARYREQKRQNKDSCKQRRGHEQREQMRAMRAEIQQVLTPEQREQARYIMSEQHRKVQGKQARELAHILKMTKEQKKQWLNKVKSLRDEYQWPLDMDQHEQSRAQFEATLKALLTPEQTLIWQEMKQKHQHKWQHQEAPHPCVES